MEHGASPEQTSRVRPRWMIFRHRRLHPERTSNERSTRTTAKRLGLVAAMAVAVAVGLSASHALAAIPHSTTGVITGCYDSSGALRVVDAQQGGTCAAGETQVTWNSTIISATRWGSGAVRPLTRAAGVAQVVLHQPTNPLPAGSWIMSATVMIANSEEISAFRCWMQARASLAHVGGQLQEWGGADGWHDSMTIPGLVTLAQPDRIDVYCSHDNLIESQTGWVQVEAVEVIAQRVATTF